MEKKYNLRCFLKNVPSLKTLKKILLFGLIFSHDVYSLCPQCTQHGPSNPECCPIYLAFFLITGESHFQERIGEILSSLDSFSSRVVEMNDIGESEKYRIRKIRDLINRQVEQLISNTHCRESGVSSDLTGPLRQSISNHLINIHNCINRNPTYQYLTIRNGFKDSGIVERISEYWQNGYLYGQLLVRFQYPLADNVVGRSSLCEITYMQYGDHVAFLLLGGTDTPNYYHLVPIPVFFSFLAHITETIEWSLPDISEPNPTNSNETETPLTNFQYMLLTTPDAIALVPPPIEEDSINHGEHRASHNIAFLRSFIHHGIASFLNEAVAREKANEHTESNHFPSETMAQLREQLTNTDFLTEELISDSEPTLTARLSFLDQSPLPSTGIIQIRYWIYHRQTDENYYGGELVDLTYISQENTTSILLSSHNNTDDIEITLPITLVTTHIRGFIRLLVDYIMEIYQTSLRVRSRQSSESILTESIELHIYTPHSLIRQPCLSPQQNL